MTTLSRKLRRANCRNNGSEWPAREQFSEVLSGGGYRTLRPTKGWMVVSAKRLRAQARFRDMAERLAVRRAYRVKSRAHA